MTQPIADLPVNLRALEVEVSDMERMIVLLQKKAEHQTFLLRHGIAWSGPQPTMPDIIRLVAMRHGLTPEDITDGGAQRSLCEARHESMYLCRRQLKPDGLPRWSLPQIGDAHGELHHTSVIHAVRRHEGRLSAAGVMAPEPLAARRHAPLKAVSA